MLFKTPDAFYNQHLESLLQKIDRQDGEGHISKTLRKALALNPTERFLSAQAMLESWKREESPILAPEKPRAIRNIPYVWCFTCRKSYPIPPAIDLEDVRYCPGCRAPAHHHVVVDAEGIEREIPLPQGAFPIPREDGAVEFVLPVDQTVKVTIGRDEQNQWKFHLPAISRRHCDIAFTPHGMVIQNHRPRLPTLLNSDQLQPESQVTVRFHGVVSLGELVFILYDRVFFGGKKS